MQNVKLIALSMFVAACGGSDSSSGKALPEKIALVSDWAQGTLSIVDYDKLTADGGTRASATTNTIDMSMYPPGAFEAVVTPDKKHALVSCGASFFSIGGTSAFLLGGTRLPDGTGGLLLVDLERGEVVKQLGTVQNPADIVFTSDGKRAIVVGFGPGAGPDSTIEVVDLEKQEVVQTVPAGMYAEGLAIDDTGTVGVYTFGTQGELATFPVSDPSKISPEISKPGDTAGIAFFPGTKTIFAIQAVAILSAISGGNSNGGYTIVDASNPAAPVVTDDVRLDESPVGFPVTAAPGRGTVLTAVTVDQRMLLREYGLENGKAKLVKSIDVAASPNLFSGLSIAFDGAHTALISWPTTRSIVSVDLDSGAVRTFDWSAPNGQVGPAYVSLALNPAPTTR